MCGIAGICELHSSSISHALLDSMLAVLVHRGPDAKDVHIRGNIGLAHSRLSIIDLEGGRQPMSIDNEMLWITFNGEIFNYVELRNELIQKGHTFATRSDTEVILHMYQEEGEDCVHRLNGQWAFAIWDEHRKKLFLSRDRVGIRPLFYTQTADAFLFASEIKALLVHPGVERNLDLEALDQIFTFWVTLPPRTAFKGIKELPPGVNPTRHKSWGLMSYLFFPNFMLLIWKTNWVLTYHYWPTSHNTHIFEGTCYFAPPKNARERLAQELGVVSFKEYGLQDGNTLEATQRMLESRTPVRTFPLNDQEIMLRHLHKQAQNYVQRYQQSKTRGRS